MTVVDMGDLPESKVSIPESSELARRWPPAVITHTRWRQPEGVFTPKTRVFFCCGNSAADISKFHTFRWDPLADEALDSGGSEKLGPLGPIHTKDARFFCCGNSAADISKSHTFKWGPSADEVLDASRSSPTE